MRTSAGALAAGGDESDARAVHLARPAIDAAATAGFALAIAAGALVRVPLPGTPVPVTAQTLVVLVGAGSLGLRRGAAGALAYGLLGVAGVPWFAVSSGATLGYVAGFVAAAALVGAAADRRLVGTLPRALAVTGVAHAVVYAFGVPVLALVAGLDLRAALAAGLAPFVVGDAAKVVAAAAVLTGASRRRSDGRGGAGPDARGIAATDAG